MKEPALTFSAVYFDAPPSRFWKRVQDDCYEDPAKGDTCVVWRGRWVIVADVDLLGWADRQLREGRAGLRWEKGKV